MAQVVESLPSKKSWIKLQYCQKKNSFKTSLLFKKVSKCCLQTSFQKEKKRMARHWCLTPVILGTWEAEIRKIAVWGQPGQEVTSKTLSQSITGHYSTCLSSQLPRKHKIGGSPSWPACTKVKTLSQKQPQEKRLEMWLRQWNACLISTKYWVQTPVPPKKQRE
jgi:hypothetical protein